jgi:hypothetical protein
MGLLRNPSAQNQLECMVGWLKRHTIPNDGGHSVKWNKTLKDRVAALFFSRGLAEPQFAKL